MTTDHATILAAGGVDDAIQNVFGPFVDVLEKIVFFSVPVFGADLPLVVLWLFIAGLVMSTYLRIRPIRDAKQTVKIIQGHLARHDDPGDMTTFQALATELAGTVGLGNIAGVAVAISVGGPGAAVWIMIAGILGMALKLCEATLAQMYRRVNEDESISGGPMYYLADGLADVGKPKLGKALGFFYGFCFMFAAMGASNIFQSNQLATHVIDITGGQDSPLAGNGWIIGVVLMVPAAFVILGGLEKIAAYTGKLVPVMSALYALCVIIIIAINIKAVPEAFSLMFQGAFTDTGVKGGVLGVAIIGIQRALFSNVAGVGTAGIAHSATKNNRPAEEGLVAAWEPFIDSVVVCTLTSLAIITTGAYKEEGADGITMTTNVFATVNSWFPYLLSLCIILFAFSTILSYSYYGRKAAGYVFGGSKKAEKAYDIVYLVMIVVGAAVTLSTVIQFSDSVFFLVAIPNILGLYLLLGPLKREIQSYRDKLDEGRVKDVPEIERSTMMGKPTRKLPKFRKRAKARAQAKAAGAAETKSNS